MSTFALELRDVSKHFGKTQIIRGVNLEVAKGERHALIGPNGAGKSTLFNLISGRFPVSSGEILLHDRLISNKAPHEIHRMGLARSFQITNIFPSLSVFENVRCAVLGTNPARYSLWGRVGRRAALSAQVGEILAKIRLTHRADEPAALLPYAEQRALEIGLAIASEADVILLDEPTAGMSLQETRAVVTLIREVTVGRTLLMVEHDMGVVFDLADRISVLVYGEVIASGDPESVRADAKVQEAYLGTHEEALT
jgi:branched-chain amino acid transport system ATP-binding protein